MGGRLATYVHLEGRVWGPGDDVPDEVAAQITHPRAWADDESDQAQGAEPDPAETPARRRRAGKSS